MKRNDYTIEKRHINDIQPGDTVLRAGELWTVTSGDIKDDTFMGRTLFGDSYNLGYNLVTVAVFSKPRSDKFTTCQFVDLRPADRYYGVEVLDRNGNAHKIIGKRGDWLYITDRDRILTASQLNDLICQHPQTIPAARLLREEIIRQAAERLKARG